MLVTGGMVIKDAFDVDPKIADFFVELGMHCLGCASVRGETIEEACRRHGADLDGLLSKINGYLQSKG